MNLSLLGEYPCRGGRLLSKHPSDSTYHLALLPRDATEIGQVKRANSVEGTGDGKNIRETLLGTAFASNPIHN